MSDTAHQITPELLRSVVNHQDAPAESLIPLALWADRLEHERAAERFVFVKAPKPDDECECCEPTLVRWEVDGWTVRAGIAKDRVDVCTPTATTIRSSSIGMRALAAALLAAADHAEGKTR